MTDQLDFDDLDGIARASWTIASRICTCGTDYHRVHPVLRVLGKAPGISRDRDVLNQFLPAMVEPGARLLIAGAADAGLLQYLVENCPARPLSITIVDRCPAPLALVARIRLPAGVEVETRQLDLTELDNRNRYDLILSHDMMNFVDPPTRLLVIRRLGDSLDADGRLVLVVRVAPSTPQFSAAEQAEPVIASANEKLNDFPDLLRFCGAELPVALRHHLTKRANLKAKIEQPDEILEAIEKAGLISERHILGTFTTSLPLPDGTERQRRSHIFVIRRT